MIKLLGNFGRWNRTTRASHVPLTRGVTDEHLPCHSLLFHVGDKTSIRPELCHEQRQTEFMTSHASKV